MSSSFWLLGVEPRDFSHAACKADQIKKMTTIFTRNDDSFKRLNDRLDNLTGRADQIRSIAKSREVINIQNRAGQKSYVSSELGGNAVQFDLELANEVRSEFDQDVIFDYPLLRTNDGSSIEGSTELENINVRPVQQSAIELADDDIDIPMLAAE